MRNRNGGFTLLEMLITIGVLAVLALLMSRLAGSTFKTIDQTRSADRGNAAMDRALMLLRQDAWSAGKIGANADGSITVGEATWRSADSTVTRSQGGDETLRVGTPIALRVEAAEVVVETAGRVIRMTGPMLKGGAK
jgi:prepilin-type N-terminal cleavage/methylation domain-containing protein